VRRDHHNVEYHHHIDHDLDYLHLDLDDAAQEDHDHDAGVPAIGRQVSPLGGLLLRRLSRKAG